MKMRRILCLLLAFLMIFSMAACDKKDEPIDTDVPETSGEATTEATEVTTEAPTTEEVTTEPETDDGKTPAPEYNGVFKAGYSRVAITPATSLLPLGGFTEIKNDIYATCVAFFDGENTAILISVDQKSIPASTCDGIKLRVKNATGVPENHIYVSATHNHSTFTFETSNVWSMQTFTKIANAAKEAVQDLSDTEIFIGRGDSKGMAFVRRYVDVYGKYSSVVPAENAIRSVRDPDSEIQVVRFERKDKKDIVMTNWQAHLAHAVDMDNDAISSDMAHYIREDIEAGDDDTLVVYFAGASANINLVAASPRLQKYPDYIAVAKAFATKVLDVIKDENLKKVNAGKITVTTEVYEATHETDTLEEIAAAQHRLDNNIGGVLELAGDRYLVARNKRPSTNLNIAAISFGDLAFITVPYEMFDNNGVEVKKASPFKMTFILTNAGGDYAYMPALEACGEGGYGGYETKTTYFAPGVAEGLVSAYVRMLNSHRGIS